MFESTAPALSPAAWLRFDAIQRGLTQANPHRVLEVGTGKGAMGWRLAQRFEYIGLEPDPISFSIASQRLKRLGAGRIIAATTEDIESIDPFDLVCAFEVLEHISDDRAELARWARLLRPGGYVLLSVPAQPDRFGPADVAVGHHRRYEKIHLKRVLKETGFQSLWIEPWGAGLGHVLEWVRNRIASRADAPEPGEGKDRSGRWLQPEGLIAAYLTAAVAAPFRVLQSVFRGRDIGIGWVALARQVQAPLEDR